MKMLRTAPPIPATGPDLEYWCDSKILTDSAEDHAFFAYWFLEHMFGKKPGETIDAEEARVLAAAIQANGQVAASVIALKAQLLAQQRQHEHEREMLREKLLQDYDE